MNDSRLARLTIMPPISSVRNTMSQIRGVIRSRLEELDVDEGVIAKKAGVHKNSLVGILKSRSDDMHLSTLKGVMSALGYNLSLRLENVHTQAKITIKI